MGKDYREAGQDPSIPTSKVNLKYASVVNGVPVDRR